MAQRLARRWERTRTGLPFSLRYSRYDLPSCKVGRDSNQTQSWLDEKDAKNLTWM